MPLSLIHLLFIAQTRHIHAKRETLQERKSALKKENEEEEDGEDGEDGKKQQLKSNATQHNTKTTTMTEKKIEKINSTFSPNFVFCSFSSKPLFC